MQPDTASWRWETDPIPPSSKICAFVTYSPDGEISRRAAAHAAMWRNEGYQILFVVVLDDMTKHPRIPFGYGICRENVGHDFAAWARALSEIPLRETEVLATVNDSVFANASLSKAIRRAEQSNAQVIGFTENWEGRWHIQSYAVIFKGKCIRSNAFKKFWEPHIGTRQQVIYAYEMPMGKTMRSAGFLVDVLFPIDCKSNPTILCAEGLLENGFPYIKKSYFEDNPKDFYRLFDNYGFDRELI